MIVRYAKPFRPTLGVSWSPAWVGVHIPELEAWVEVHIPELEAWVEDVLNQKMNLEYHGYTPKYLVVGFRHFESMRLARWTVSLEVILDHTCEEPFVVCDADSEFQRYLLAVCPRDRG